MYFKGLKLRMSLSVNIMDTNMMCILTGSRLFFEEKQVEMVKRG